MNLICYKRVFVNGKTVVPAPVINELQNLEDTLIVYFLIKCYADF